MSSFLLHDNSAGRQCSLTVPHRHHPSTVIVTQTVTMCFDLTPFFRMNVSVIFGRLADMPKVAYAASAVWNTVTIAVHCNSCLNTTSFKLNDVSDLALLTLFTLFTQPPMRRMRICFTDVFFVFFLFFFRLSQKYQTTVLGNG